MPAITSLSTLKAAAADALVRSDFTDRIASSVALAEAWLNRNLRLRMMEAEVELNAARGARTIALPEGFLEPLALFREEAAGRVAMPFKPGGLETHARGATPQNWTVDGDAIAFAAPCDVARTFTLRMLKRFALVSEEDSNTLLDTWPDLYLTALLTVVAGIYLTDDPRLSAWKFSRDELLSEVIRKEARSAATLAALVADVSLLDRRCA